MSSETYLGDAVYAKFNGYALEIYVTDGVTRSEPIVLEWATYVALTHFARGQFQQEPPR